MFWTYVFAVEDLTEFIQYKQYSAKVFFPTLATYVDLKSSHCTLDSLNKS